MKPLTKPRMILISEDDLAIAARAIREAAAYRQLDAEIEQGEDSAIDLDTAIDYEAVVARIEFALRSAS
jgi:hypothetical protein